MGYESRIDLVSLDDSKSYGQFILSIDMGCVEEGLLNFFQNNIITFNYYVPNRSTDYRKANKINDAFNDFLKAIGREGVELDSAMETHNRQEFVDNYGKSYTYTTDVDGVITWLESRKEEYRRYKTLYNLLQNYKDYGDNVVLVHSGY